MCVCGARGWHEGKSRETRNVKNVFFMTMNSTACSADPFVLLAAISAPQNGASRSMIRRFLSLDGVHDPDTCVEFVVGDQYHSKAKGTAERHRQWLEEAAQESRAHGDLVRIRGREGLPHVGKATEKSAAWWLSAPLRSRAKWFCKTDDDSLVHAQHLHAALAAALTQAPTEHILFSYVRWRGWLPNGRLQACGGGWGGPLDAIKQARGRWWDAVERVTAVP